MESYVTLKIENKVGYVEFYHPNRNSMPSDVLELLAKKIEQAGENKDVNIVVLKSGGDRTFCAGASFNEIVMIEDEEAGFKFFSGFANVINAIRKCPKLIIGRVQGKSVGGGVGLAAATDYCLATKYASIKLSELSIGIGPFVIEPVVSRKMGKNTMAQMTIDAETFFSPEFAKRKGLFFDVFETIEELDDAVETLACKLTGYNPEALKEMKKIMWDGTENWGQLLSERAKISGKLVLSEFTKQVIERFKE
jgi:methylglutaconyl-CoA hydratase